MVKPSKRMQPEAVDLDKIEKKGTRGMGGDDFSNYMARKISLQRGQFGLVVPPDPSEQQQQQQQRRQVRFADDVQDASEKRKIKDMSSLLKHLKKRHGSCKSRKRRKSPDEQGLHSEDDSCAARKPQHLQYSHEQSFHSQDDSVIQAPQPAEYAEQKTASPEVLKPSSQTSPVSPEVLKPSSQTSPVSRRPKHRPDLFFWGIVVMVNGYTSPDNETLMRLLHKHGGELEKYETTRITHIIAQNLSTAKANMYKRQRMPRPVCRPEWIVESAKAGRLLPHGNYLIDEVQPEATTSVKKFFVQQVSPANEEKDGSGAKMDLEKRAAMSDLLYEIEMGGSKEGGNVDVQGSASSFLLGDHPTNSTAGVYQSEMAANTVDTAADSQTPHETGTASSGGALTNVPSPTKLGAASFPRGTTRTVGTDPNFLQSFFSASRLSFIGSFKQRARHSPTKKVAKKSISFQKFVFLVDMDSFFASVVLRNFPEYRDKPVAISHMGKQGQKGPGGNPTQQSTKASTSECATCNYEARKYGIKKGMFLGRARELCPHLIVLDYDFEGYEEVSEQVTDIMYRVAEVYDGTVEQVSCDEAYMELFLSSDDCSATPEELAWKIAESVRNQVFETTQCTATVGVASNKLLAKLAADQAKPNKSMVVQDYRALLEPLNLRDLHGIGYRMERKLTAENLISVSDVWDLGDHAESELIRILGPGLGRKIWLFCKGVDDRPVKPAARKTIGAECNYGVRFDGPYGVDYMMEGLAKEIQKRMESVGVKGSHVTLKVKQRKLGAMPPPKFLGHGSCHNLSKSTDTAGSTPTQDWNTIAHISMALFKQLAVPIDDIRGMGIVVSKLVSDRAKQVNSESSSSRITSFFGGEPTRNPAEHASSHAADVSGSHEIEDLKSVASFAGTKFLGTATSQAANSGPFANPTLSQVDMNVLASFPLDIRNEIEEQLGCSYHSKRVQTEESSVGQQGSLNVSSQHNYDDLSPETSTPQNASSEWHGDDLALPPFSQIHMSQVAELPSPLRKNITAKVMAQRTKHRANLAHDQPVEKLPPSGRAYARVAERCTGSKHAREDQDGHAMRQLSVKRMLKLAAVKSGQDTDLSNRLGGFVSLTQLECLPLEMQLQVANDEDIDSSFRTTSSPSLKARRSLVSESKPRASSSPSSNAANESKVFMNLEDVLSTQVEIDYTAPSISQMPSFYQENIKPMKEYMDANPDVSDDVSQKVRDFICIVVTERRFVDAVKLLRSIKNRGDEWSGHAYLAIRSAVDERTKEVLGRPLDLLGLGL